MLLFRYKNFGERFIYYSLIVKKMKASDYTELIQICSDPRIEDVARNISRVFVNQFSPVPLRLPEELEKKVQDAWKQEVAQAQEGGKPAPRSNPFVYCSGYTVKNSLDAKADIGFE